MNQKDLKIRTKNFAIKAIKIFNQLPKTDAAKIVGRQFIRSATSIGANYRAATLARSKKEFYAKLCIVVEETDESIYWLEIMHDTSLLSTSEVENLKNEANELLLIFSKSRKTTKDTL